MAKIKITQSCTYELNPENYKTHSEEEVAIYYHAINSSGLPESYSNTPPSVGQMLAMEKDNLNNDPALYVEVFELARDTAVSIELVTDKEEGAPE